jgi:aryl-alcohol dehydrogenase-like predicted oxidoreductase
MHTTTLGPLDNVSRLTLGGGGIGALWGPTTREEGIATLREAPDHGVTLIDSAPGYNICEELIGEAFNGALPDGVRITTKCGIGNFEPGTAYAQFRASLEKSFADMRVDHVDLFFLHGHIRESEPWVGDPSDADVAGHTRWAAYVDEVVPAFERLIAEGLTSHWGLTGVDMPQAIIDAVSREARPAAIQSVANLLDSPGTLTDGRGAARPRDIIAAAKEHGVGVLGIRVVQAGALCAVIDRPLESDHPEVIDYGRAEPFRDLCRLWGEAPEIIAHRYALGMDGVDTVILGVKNRDELREIVAAEAAGPLEAEQVAAIDALGLRRD